MFNWPNFPLLNQSHGARPDRPFNLLEPQIRRFNDDFEAERYVSELVYCLIACTLAFQTWHIRGNSCCIVAEVLTKVVEFKPW